MGSSTLEERPPTSGVDGLWSRDQAVRNTAAAGCGKQELLQKDFGVKIYCWSHVRRLGCAILVKKLVGLCACPLFWKSGNLIVAIRVLHAGPCGIRALLHRVLQELRPSQIIHDEEDSILPVQTFSAASIGTFGKEPLCTLEFLSRAQPP